MQRRVRFGVSGGTDYDVGATVPMAVERRASILGRVHGGGRPRP